MKEFAGPGTLAAFAAIVKGAIAAAGGESSGPGGVPVGSVMFWPGRVDAIPANWAPCDGQDGRPDYRGVFLLGADADHPVGGTGGSETVTLTTAQMPAHIHNISIHSKGAIGNTDGIGGVGTSGAGSSGTLVNTRTTGGSTPHNNMPPFATGTWIIKIAPDPALDGVTMDMVNAAIAEAMKNAGGGVPSGLISIWSGAASNVPDGWTLCNGSNGTPDLRDKFVLGAGAGTSGPAVGSTGGEKEVTLTTAQMPSHNHRTKPALSLSGIISAGPVFSGNKGGEYQYTEKTGGSQPHNNMPPYYALAYIMKL